MAAVTLPICGAGDGAFSVSITYDNVTQIVATMTYTLLSGTAATVFDGVQTVPLSTIGTHVVPVPGTRALNKGAGISCRWGSS